MAFGRRALAAALAFAVAATAVIYAPSQRSNKDAPYTALLCIALLILVIWSYVSVLEHCSNAERGAPRPTSGLSEAKVEVRNAPGKGMGAYALEPIEAGSWVCQYVGRLVDAAEYERLWSQKDDSLLEYMFKVVDPEVDGGDAAVFLDAKDSRHHSRYFNHDEDGNLEVEVVPKERRIEFFAARDICAGEELTFDYGEAYWTGGQKPVAESDARARWTRDALPSGEPFWYDEDGEITLNDPYRPSSAYSLMEQLSGVSPNVRTSGE